MVLSAVHGLENNNIDTHCGISNYISKNISNFHIETKEPKNPVLQTVEEKIAFLRTHKHGRLSLIPIPNHWADELNSIRSCNLRSLLHLDYIASAQSLDFIELYMNDLAKTYANTHTETSATGKVSTERFHDAIEIIREHVNAGKDSFVIPSGYGATAAIEKIQKILGIYFSPRGQKQAESLLGLDLKKLMSKKIVVLVGPYEHHSNDVTWQNAALCKFIRIKAIKEGPNQNDVDLDDLKRELEKHPDHIKIGSFSAASNVTGIKSNLSSIGKLLHQHGALFFVDYAASGPYSKIDMIKDNIDAIFLSMHKNLGGSNLGVLIGKNKIYDLQADPSFGGGGTVSAVTPWEYHFHHSIEGREYSGTPAIRPVLQAALSVQVKDWIGCEEIEKIDKKLVDQVMDFFKKHPNLEILGNPYPEKRYPIFSFLVKHGDKMLNHTYVSALLNDLFGIQARAGCACAGPYGHELLNITKDLSDKYLNMILRVFNGFKPGWTRIGTHYTMSEEELSYTFKALGGVAWFGALFLDQYAFNPYSGEWKHKKGGEENEKLGLDKAILCSKENPSYPELKNESELYQAFNNQYEEFVLLCAVKTAKRILESIPEKRDYEQLAPLVELCIPRIKELIEDPSKSAKDFSNLLSQDSCSLLTGSSNIECQNTICEMIESLLFKPQNHTDRYEPFKEVESGVDFFYVWKGNLFPPIKFDKNIDNSATCPRCFSRLEKDLPTNDSKKGSTYFKRILQLFKKN